MGQARITGGGPTALYDIEVVKHPGTSAARLAAIAQRLILLAGIIPTAEEAVVTALDVLTAAQAILDSSILKRRIPLPSLEAIPRWNNDGNGQCTQISPGPSCVVGGYSVIFGAIIAGDPFTSPAIPDSIGWYVQTPGGSQLPVARTGKYQSSEINFTTAEGSEKFESGDAFDIAVTEETRAVVTPVSKAMEGVITAQAEVTKTRAALRLLKAERESLTTEQARLTAAMAVEARAGIWCTDLTENLAVGANVGTMEINGVDDQIILAPGGDVGKSLGLLQHAGVSTPSAVFLNRARLPGWQKWKPTYRVATITAIDYATDKCDVGIEAQFSEEQGLPINQTGAAYEAVKASIAGWDDFAARNSSFPLVTNTESTTIPLTPQVTADLAYIQNYVNSRFNYRLDEDLYGKLEHWSIMEAGGSGDCEDFSLTKAKMLLDMGYPASAIHIEVGATPNGDGHAWLVVQTDKGDYALDNLYLNPMPNGVTPYTNRRRQTGLAWSQPGVKLTGVAIEYMDGMNAAPFIVGDRVVVQFVGQAWTTPKVVGFETNPRAVSQHLVRWDPIDGSHVRALLIQCRRGTYVIDKQAVLALDHSETLWIGWDNNVHGFVAFQHRRTSLGGGAIEASLRKVTFKTDGSEAESVYLISPRNAGGPFMPTPGLFLSYDAAGAYTVDLWESLVAVWEGGDRAQGEPAVVYHNLTAISTVIDSSFQADYGDELGLGEHGIAVFAWVSGEQNISVAGWGRAWYGEGYYEGGTPPLGVPSFVRRINGVETAFPIEDISHRSYDPHPGEGIVYPPFSISVIGVKNDHIYYSIYEYPFVFDLATQNIQVRKAPLSNLSTYEVISDLPALRRGTLLSSLDAIAYMNGSGNMEVRAVATNALLYTIPEIPFSMYGGTTTAVVKGAIL